MADNEDPTRFDPTSITRPVPELLTYYTIIALFSLPAMVVLMPLLYFKYHTLKYSFDDKGVSMSWGILFRREIYLTYRRIQDIHVSKNFIQRWMGLASVGVQTASGTSGAEMTIEGIRNPETLRDYLYTKMRGSSDDADDGAVTETDSPADEALVLLQQIRDELRTLRQNDRSEAES